MPSNVDGIDRIGSIVVDSSLKILEIGHFLLSATDLQVGECHIFSENSFGNIIVPF